MPFHISNQTLGSNSQAPVLLIYFFQTTNGVQGCIKVVPNYHFVSEAICVQSTKEFSAA